MSTRHGYVPCVCVNGLSQSTSRQSHKQDENVIEDLLRFPTPTPQNRPVGPAQDAEFSWDSPPPDDATLDVLGLYWSRSMIR